MIRDRRCVALKQRELATCQFYSFSLQPRVSIYDPFESLGTSKRNSFRRNLQVYVTLSSLQVMSFSPIAPEVCKEPGSAVCPLSCWLLPEPKLWCSDRWADFCLLPGVVPDLSCTVPTSSPDNVSDNSNLWIPKTSLQNTTSFQAFWCKFPLGGITQQSPDALRIRVLDPAKVRLGRLSTKGPRLGLGG